MKKILVIGSLNMDVTLEVPHIPIVGETILADSVTHNRGGKGANQAVAIRRLGAETAMIGAVGNDDFGEDLLKGLKDEGIDVSGIIVKDTVSGTAYIKVDREGNNNIVVATGANFELTPQDIRNKEELIKSADYCVFQLEIPQETVKEAVKICKENNVKVIMNPAPAIKDLDEFIVKNSDYMMPNESELEILSGEKLTEDNLLDICQSQIDRGVNKLVVTLGDKGSLYFDGEKHEFVGIIPTKTVDTTGAGDSFIGAFVNMLSEGKDDIEAIKYASAVGSLTVSRAGAQKSLPSREEADKYYQEKVRNV